MARPREFDKTEAMERIKHAFWARGYDGLSYADLMEATGLHKASLYAAFGDKRTLYLIALEAYIQIEVEGAVSALQQGSRNQGINRIKKSLDSIIDDVKDNSGNNGCFLCNAAVEQAPHDSDTQSLVSAGLNQMKKGFYAALQDDSGLASFKPKELEALASTITSVYFGMRVMSKSGVSIAMLKQARDGLMKQIRQPLA